MGSTSLSFLVRQLLSIQKIRIACQLRIKALTKQGVGDEETKWLSDQAKKLEEEAKERLKDLLKSHLVWSVVWENWLSRVNGIGELLAGEIIGGFESALKEGETLGNHFKTVSQMWAFAGLDVKDGKAPKTKRKEKQSFNNQLRSLLLGRLGVSILRMSRSTYRDYYDQGKKQYYQRLQKENKKIVPASKLPKKDGKRYEPLDMISEGHIHQMALRKMVKLFVSHLWEMIRRAEGLEAGGPYVIEVLGHGRYLPPFYDKER